MALDGAVVDVGVLNGGRWCDAYPLICDLVREPYRAMYYIYLVLVLWAIVLTHRDNNG